MNVKIIDDEEYEKNKTFTIVLEEPVLLEVGQRHGELKVQQQCGPLPEELNGLWFVLLFLCHRRHQR